MTQEQLQELLSSSGTKPPKQGFFSKILQQTENPDSLSTPLYDKACNLKAQMTTCVKPHF
jgi:hypothetical protein